MPAGVRASTAEAQSAWLREGAAPERKAVVKQAVLLCGSHFKDTGF